MSTHDHVCISRVLGPVVTLVASLGVAIGLLDVVNATGAPAVSVGQGQACRFVNGTAVADMGADESWDRIHLPLVLKGGMPDLCQPPIAITHVPDWGTSEDLRGRVECVEPEKHEVAVYLFVANGWWTKPTWDEPLTPIQADGTWTCDITTGGIDEQGTEIAAFLVPDGYDPPLGRGEQTLPQEMFDSALAYVVVEREPKMRKVEFSGRTWIVKQSDIPVGPGPNYFSDLEEDIWVDQDGRLHMRIVEKDGRWYSTEVLTAEPLGYGKYIFRLANRVDQLDKNIVLGLFTWDGDAPEHHYREIDIEFARWGDEDNENSQYVVQPWDRPENMYRFDTDLQGAESTHGFDWRADRVFFQSLHGHQPFPGPAEDEIASWTYSGDDVPPAGGAEAVINLWLTGGTPPSDEQPAEVVIEAFEHVPHEE